MLTYTLDQLARLLDPASGLDELGALVSEGTRIAELGPRVLADGVPEAAADDERLTRVIAEREARGRELFAGAADHWDRRALCQMAMCLDLLRSGSTL